LEDEDRRFRAVEKDLSRGKKTVEIPGRNMAGGGRGGCRAVKRR